MIKGNITHTRKGYTVSVFKDGERVYKSGPYMDYDWASSIMKSAKKEIARTLSVDTKPVKEREEWKRSYPELEGKIIFWKNKNYDNRHHRVKVAGIDYDIGISLVNPSDPTDHYSCYHGPESPVRKNGHDAMSLEQYDKAFQYIIGVIQRGELYDVQKVRQSFNYTGTFGGSGLVCAFTQ